MIITDVNKYLKSGKYLPIDGAEGRSYRHVLGWTNHLIARGLLYSHRDTVFTAEQFDEAYHAHTFYELIVYVCGDVDFICNQNILTPPPMSVIWSRPGDYHNARLLSESRYERYVFRFEPEVFCFEGEHFAPLGFMRRGADFFAVPPEHRNELMHELSALDACFESTPSNRLQAYAIFLRLMAFFDRIADTPRASASALPETVLRIKSYVEENYRTITTVREVSEHFFYSREHISRLFKQYFNMSVAEFLTRYRIARSAELLESGMSVTDVCYAVGFGSISAFSASFRRIKGCLPSHWMRNVGGGI